MLFTITFLGILLVMNNPASSPFKRTGYHIFLDLQSAPGVAVNTPVRKDGVLVGRVAGLEWTDTGVRLKIQFDDPQVEIHENDTAQVEPSSIFGDAVVKFTRQPHEVGKPPLLAGAVMQGTALEDPVSALTKLQQNLGPSIEKLGVAGERISVLADKVNVILGDEVGSERLQSLLDEMTVTLRDFRRTTNNVDSLIADPELRDQLKQGLREFPGVMSDARVVLQNTNQSLAAFDRVVASAGENLENLEGLTEPLGQRGPELADLLISAIENLDIVMADMSRFTKSLSSSEGTLGRLVNDPVLYNNANLLVQDLDVVVRAIHHDVIAQGRLRKIVDDLGVFLDKVAREPGRIVGGALNPSIRK